MSNRTSMLLPVTLVLGLVACSGQQTARTHVQSDQPVLALQVVDDWRAQDGAVESLASTDRFASVLEAGDAELGTARDGELRLVAQELLELLNQGRADEAWAIIQERGLERYADPAMMQALMGQSRGMGGLGGHSGANAFGGASLEALLGGESPLLSGLVLDQSGGSSVDGGPALSIESAFDSHKSAFDGIGP